MPNLSDSTDRLAQHAKAIRQAAKTTGIVPGSDGVNGPFTRAVLNTPLGNLIRDIDPSELGLFTLVNPTQPSSHGIERDAKGNPRGEITRVEFPGATPLRKPARREELQRLREPEPEIYAQAALKYLDRYRSIRPMPRAHSQVLSLIDELAILRENIEALNESLERASSAGGSRAPTSPRSLADTEERRIQELQSKIAELKKRKEAILNKKEAPRSKIPSSRLIRPPSKPRVEEQPPVASSSKIKSDLQEDLFWNTPAAPTRTLHFTENLLTEEQPDLGDTSAVSFTSPTVPRNQPLFPQSLYSEGELEDNDEGTAGSSPLEYDSGDQLSTECQEEPLQEIGEDEGEEEAEEDGEQTIVLKKPPAQLQPIDSPTPSIKRPILEDANENEVEISPSSPLRASDHPKKTKVKVTSEMERIVLKIWSTVGDIIMPGHPFDTTGGMNKPPRANATITHLSAFSSQDPSPPSPSASSLSSTAPSSGTPTLQQILTAHLILTLLSSPNFSMPLNKVKDALTTKAGGKANQGTTRALYGCVAKKLLKIDRGGGEQIVTFDI